MSDTEYDSIIEDEREYTDEEMHALIDGTITDFDDGDLVNGTVVRVERDEVLVDIGYKSEGVIPARELSIRKDADPNEVVTVGEPIEALVLQKEDKDGRLILSKKRAEYERAWVSIEEKFNSGEVVEGEVIEVVKGGLIIDIGLRGFLPASLVDLRRVKDLSVYTGQALQARVIEMDRNRNNVVLSRRVVLEEDRKQERQDILGKLTKGMQLPGTVSSIVDFGAFVDLGGIDGLVHISELSWSHVNHPSEVVQVGDKVNVQVLDVDLDRERISLGLKQTTEDPWRTLVKNYPIGSIIKGKVTKLVPFGAFVELGDGVEGLVHISEMAKGHVETPEQVLTVGEEVHVKVQDVDLDRRRISLSIRAAAEALGIEIKEPPAREDEDELEGAEAEAEETAMDVVAGEIAAEEALEVATTEAITEMIEEGAPAEDVAAAIEAEDDRQDAAMEAIEEDAEEMGLEVVEPEPATDVEIPEVIDSEADLEQEAGAEEVLAMEPTDEAMQEAPKGRGKKKAAAAEEPAAEEPAAEAEAAVEEPAAAEEPAEGETAE